MGFKELCNLNFVTCTHFATHLFFLWFNFKTTLGTDLIVKRTQYSWNFKNVSKIFCLPGI